MIYVSTSDNNAISIIDGKTNKVVDTIRVNKPSYISVNPQTNMIYAAGYNFSSFSDFVSVIDGKTNTVVDDITLDQPASGISVNPETNIIYAAGANYISSYGIYSGSVSVIDGETNKVVDYITLDHVASIDHIDVNPKTNIVYIVSSTSDSVTAINGTTNQIITSQ
jgi:YVTN family beta-propeller protein